MTEIDTDRIAEKIIELHDRARRDRRHMESGEIEPGLPDPDLAMQYLRTGVGPTIGVYLACRTGGRRYPFTPDQFDRLEGAMNAWIECYTRCYGVDLDADLSIRTAAEAMIDTNNVRDTVQLLTRVPPRFDEESEVTTDGHRRIFGDHPGPDDDSMHLLEAAGNNRFDRQ